VNRFSTISVPLVALHSYVPFTSGFVRICELTQSLNHKSIKQSIKLVLTLQLSSEAAAES
jgi:hypothetical protein